MNRNELGDSKPIEFVLVHLDDFDTLFKRKRGVKCLVS